MEACEDNFFQCGILMQRRRRLKGFLDSQCKTGRFCLYGANGKKEQN